MRKYTFICFLVALVGPALWIYNSIVFSQNCGGYLKQAADANSVELAIERLDKAIYYIETNGLTDGYTSVLWRTEKDNIGFWYTNINACRTELENCRESSQLEQTNVLLKVRESLTNTSDGNVVLNVPNGISRYPHNLVYGLLMWLSCLAFIFGLLFRPIWW